jgi:hypothetical protein
MMSLRELTFDEIDEVSGASGPVATVTTNIDQGTGAVSSIYATCGPGYNITPNFAIGTPSFQSTVSDPNSYTCSANGTQVNYNGVTFTPESVLGITMFGFAGFSSYVYQS